MIKLFGFCKIILLLTCLTVCGVAIAQDHEDVEVELQGFERLERESIRSMVTSGYKRPVILGADLIVGALDHDHLRENLEIVLEVVSKTLVKVNKVYPYMFIGNFKNSQKLINRIWVYGVSIEPIVKLPVIYEGIGISPTWIFHTQKGAYIVEGLTNPMKYIEGGYFFQEKELLKDIATFTRVDGGEAEGTILDTVVDFESCEAEGHKITKSLPPRCVTPDGRVFTKKVKTLRTIKKYGCAIDDIHCSRTKIQPLKTLTPLKIKKAE